MEISYHLMFKILLVGNAEIRNAELLTPFVDDSLNRSTAGMHFLKKKVEIGENMSNTSRISVVERLRARKTSQSIQNVANRILTILIHTSVLFK